MMFRDRTDAGKALARMLRDSEDLEDGIVLALPRGGVPVALEIARELRLPLDVFVVRKLGVPQQPELAMGAVASGGIVVIDPQITGVFGIGPEAIQAVIARETQEIARRERIYRAGRLALHVENRTVVLVDDGIATGSTMKAAIRALQTRARRIVVAVPVAARSSADELSATVDRFVCIACPERFYAVGEFYRQFEQMTDEQVTALLAEARRHPGGSGPA